jgi:undecaprenyl-diphosphatase
VQGRRWFNQGRDWIRRQDLHVLVLTLLGALALWGFLELADVAVEGQTHVLDERLIRFFRDGTDPSDPVGPIWVQEAVRDITALGGVTVLALVTLAVAGYVAIRRQYHALAFLLGSICGGGLLVFILKEVFDRPRPELVPHLMKAGGSSFPSGHTLASAVVYLTLGALLARLVKPMNHKLYFLGLALFLTFLIGLSRIYLGVHYPTDVLAGWTMGLTWAITCWLGARHLQQRGSIEPPVNDR